jgi:hypothetical protein
MPDHAHDVRLPPLLVDCVAHGLAVDGKALVCPPKGRIPLLQG